MKYYLMHEDTKLAIFDVINNNITELKKIEDVTNYIVRNAYNNKDIISRIKARSIPEKRDNIKSDLKNMSIFEYSLANYGLSLVDHYWYCPVESKLSWNKINLYINKFNETF